jgi:hypothetical protein
MKACQTQLDQLYSSSDKDSIGSIEGEGATRGFFPIGAETGDKTNVEHKESFSFGYDAIPQAFLKQCSLVDQNIWPAILQREQFNQLHSDMTQTMVDVLKLI